MKINNIKKPAHVLTGTELLAKNISKLPMLMNPLFEKQGIASLIGGSDAGKTFLAIDLSMAICSDNTTFLGFEINSKHGSVLYISTEDNDDIFAVRMKNMSESRNFNGDKFRLIVETDNLTKKINDELDRQPADLVIIDTLGDLFVGNINSGPDVRRFLKPFKLIAMKHKCLFLFLHHMNKNGDKSAVPDKNDVSGSEALQSAFRTVISLKKLLDGTRVLTILKGNNISDEYKNKGYSLKFDPASGFTLSGKQINYQKTNIINLNGISGFDSKISDLISLMRKENKSYLQIAEELKKQGHKIDKNKVGQYIKHLSSHPEPKENILTDGLVILKIDTNE